MHKGSPHSYSGVEAPDYPSITQILADRDALLADNMRKLKKITALTEEVVALRRELAASKPVLKTPKFPSRALEHRTHSVGLIVRWP